MSLDQPAAALARSAGFSLSEVVTLLVITDDATRPVLEEALTHLSHRAGRVTCADEKHAEIHHDIDDLLCAWEHADA